MLEQVKALVAEYKDAGYNQLLIGDCYFSEQRGPNGTLWPTSPVSPVEWQRTARRSMIWNWHAH